MTAYYDILTELQTLFDADIDVNTVTQDTLDGVDLNKQTMYSLAHIMVNSVTGKSPVLTFNISVFLMDAIDQSKEMVADIFKGNDNKMDIKNTTLATLVRVMAQFERGSISESGYQLQGTPTYTPLPKFIDDVTGWEANFLVNVKTAMTIC